MFWNERCPANRRGIFAAEPSMPFAPAFCLTETHLLAAPHPQALKSHLRFVASKGARFSAKLKERLDIPDGDLLSLTFVDAKPLLQDLLAFAPYLAQLAFSRIQSEGGEIDIFSLPSARAILPYAGDLKSTVVRTEDGILFHSQNGIPIPGGGVQLLRLVLPWFLLLA